MSRKYEKRKELRSGVIFLVDRGRDRDKIKVGSNELVYCIFCTST